MKTNFENIREQFLERSEGTSRDPSTFASRASTKNELNFASSVVSGVKIGTIGVGLFGFGVYSSYPVLGTGLMLIGSLGYVVSSDAGIVLESLLELVNSSIASRMFKLRSEESFLSVLFKNEKRMWIFPQFKGITLTWLSTK